MANRRSGCDGEKRGRGGGEEYDCGYEERCKHVTPAYCAMELERVTRVSFLLFSLLFFFFFLFLLVAVEDIDISWGNMATKMGRRRKKKSHSSVRTSWR